MIRTLLAMLLALGALVGASLRIAREGEEPIPAVAHPPAPSARTVDLGPPPEPVAALVPTPLPLAVEEIDPPGEASFVEGPASGPEAADPPALVGPSPPAPVAPDPSVATALDQDAWAGLIRRMLELYRRSGDAR